MENMIFLIDLPRLPEGQRTTKEDMTSFGTELIYFLEAMGLEHSIIDSIYYFDYTATKDLAFIHSIGGEHSGESWQRTGYCGLGQAVKQLGLGTEKPLHIDCVTSSLGALNDDFLAMLYLSAQGDNGLKEYTWRNPPVVSKKKKAPQEDSQEDSQPIENSRERLLSHLRDRFHVYFPTHNTVKKSLAGFAGTICFRSNWYNSPSFPREVLRECISVRRRMLMHNKVQPQCPSLQVQARTNHHRCCWFGQRMTRPFPGRTSAQRIVQRLLGASWSRMERQKGPNSTAVIGSVGCFCRRVGKPPGSKRVT